MYNMNDILKLMDEGKTADDLAKEFTEALNAANAEVKRRKEEEMKAILAAEEARKISEAARKEKAAMLTEIIDAGKKLIKRFYMDFIPDKYKPAVDEEISAEDLDALIDEIDNFAKMFPMTFALMDIESLVKPNAFPNIKVEKKPIKKTIKTISDSDANKIIHDFLSNLF